MLFVSVEDFLSQVKGIPPLSREEERELGRLKAAAYVRRAPREIRTLHTVYACIAALEQGVERFNFLQDGETFTHHLSWRLRQCLTRCIAER
ncbi:MAG: hypothetical protein IJO76_00220 [Clostridia bacterium]|nr:hypothetical protein [Clostridia bacterium]